MSKYKVNTLYDCDIPQGNLHFRVIYSNQSKIVPPIRATAYIRARCAIDYGSINTPRHYSAQCRLHMEFYTWQSPAKSGEARTIYDSGIFQSLANPGKTVYPTPYKASKTCTNLLYHAAGLRDVRFCTAKNALTWSLMASLCTWIKPRIAVIHKIPCACGLCGAAALATLIMIYGALSVISWPLPGRPLPVITCKGFL